MCGIAGVFASDGAVAREALPLIVSAQLHRGPNDAGERYIDVPAGTLALGHRRLSILDLSPAGHQPMDDPESGDVIVYNGELYNFRDIRRDLEREGCTFRSDGDTEVALRALSRWGIDALHRFQGMYALAWFRRRQMSLVLARDPLGIKPLYIARTPKGILFASEVRALLASGLVSRTASSRGIAGLLAYGAVQEPFTVFRSIDPAPSGCAIEVNLSAPPASWRPKPRRFWQFPPPNPELTEPEGVELVRSTLDSAVRDHLVSDVPVGVFLSSGIDSTVLAGLAARHAPGIETFTVAFGDNPEMSEGTVASETAERLGLRHHDIQITSRESLEGATPWLGAQDQPSMDGLNVYLVSRAVRERGITVALSGQGGDEVFGGYPSFAEVPRYMRLMRRLELVPRFLRPALARAVGLRQSAAARQKLLDMILTDGSALQLTLARRRLISTRILSMLGLSAAHLGLDPSFQTPGALADLPVSNHFPVHSISQAEVRFYMGNMLLRDSDANGMAHSLEIRVPFLDQRVVDTFLAAPRWVRLPNGGNNKHLLRAGFPEFLPDSLMARPKVGFILPIKRWMRGPLRDLCEESLRYLKLSGVVHNAGVDAVWNEYVRNPESQMWSRAWVLVALGAYVQRHQVVAEAEPPRPVGRSKRTQTIAPLEAAPART